jgi:hypothetical protein
MCAKRVRFHATFERPIIVTLFVPVFGTHPKGPVAIVDAQRTIQVSENIMTSLAGYGREPYDIKSYCKKGN